MSDISITITADPSQAIDGITKVKKSGEELADTARKAQSAADAAATDSMNSVGAISREAARAVTQTGDAVKSVGAGIKLAATEASKVSGAFGKAVPVVGQLGSAISAAITGPIGAISAAIGLAIAGITKLLRDAEDRVQRLKAMASTRTDTSYDRLMQGRQDYADQLKVLSQVKEIDALARQSKLGADQLAAFRTLAGQIGIEARDVTASGVRSGRISEAERTLSRQRQLYADQEYQDFLDAAYISLQKQIDASKINDEMKAPLKRMSLFDAVDEITARALRGAGNDLDEYKAYQELYPVVKQIAEVRASYARDSMLGRSQADLNAASVASILGSGQQAASGVSGGSSGAPAPGSLAYYKEQAKKEAAAAEQARKEQERRTEAEAKLLEGLDRQIEQQKLITEGKTREAFILQRRLQLEDAVGQLTAEQVAAVESRAGELYDLLHLAASPEPPPGSPEAVIRAARPAARAWTMPLDRLQRLGGNVTTPAVSPERAAIDRQTGIQERILNLLEVNFTASRAIGGMIFP